ncbi:hypothetical protein MASR2M47_43710 [Draconibacterium sp.]|jgi:hypothetical protein
MKKFYYSFTRHGTLIVWLTEPNEKPELLAQVAPSFTQTSTKHTQGRGMVPMQQNMANSDGVPVIIECLLYYQQYYSQN